MANISKLSIGNVQYDIKDSTARSGVSANAAAISGINSDYLSFGSTLGGSGAVTADATASALSMSLYTIDDKEVLLNFPAATISKAGVLTAADKVKIDKIDTITSDIAGGMHFIGTTKTELTDGATTATLEETSTNSLTKTSEFIAGDMVVCTTNGTIANKKEFVWTGSAWALFGDLSSLGSLAYKNSASGTLPSSSHSHTFTGTAHNHTVTVSGGDVSGTCTPQGSVKLTDVYDSLGSYTKINLSTASGNVSAAYLVSLRQLGTTTLKGVAGTTSITPFGNAGTLPTGDTVVKTVSGSSSNISVSNEILTIPASVLTGVDTTTGNALSSRGTLPSAGTAVTVATANANSTTVATYAAIPTEDSNWKSLSECITPSFTGSSTTLSLTHTNPTVSISPTTATGTISANTAYATNSSVTVR